MILSILIPTYNRPKKLGNLLKFLDLEFSKKDIDSSKVEIIIGDNSNNNKSSQIYKDSYLKNKNISYIRNKYNLGLIGNVTMLIEQSRANYTWIVGDDDLYHSGIVKKIFDLSSKATYSFVFLNHRAYFDKLNPIISSAIDYKKQSEYNDGKDLIFDVWNHSKSTLMFISSLVFKTNVLKQCVRDEKEIDIAFPLKMSFYCASKGKAKIVKEIYIDNIWGTTSWENEKSNVFNFYIPKHIYSLNKLGYNYFSARRMLLFYLIQRLKIELRRFLNRLKFFFK
jgi:hypothetical protein